MSVRVAVLLLGAVAVSARGRHAHNTALTPDGEVDVGQFRFAGSGDVWKNPCESSPLKGTDACDTSKSIDDRVQAILAQLTDDDRVGLLGNTASAVSHLAIPAYQWWSEALHGVAGSPGVKFDSQTPYATSFPQVITTSSSFNKTLFHAIGSAVGTEARAFSNVGHAGNTFWAPNVNIFRDPRWGRGQETPGEDPTLSSDYAASFPRGLQDGESWPKYIKASSCCKHFAAYSLENWSNVDRHHFNAVVSAQDLADTYYPAFQSCVQRSNASSVMCSYNAVNGVPSCAKKEILNDLLRDKWGFDGYVTSDCGAVEDVYSNHKYANTTDETCYDVLTAGMDSDCGDFLSKHLKDCIDNKICTDAVTNPALANLFRVQMRLGLYDPADEQPYLKIGLDQINTKANQQLALEAAQQGMVLLKNDNSILPLTGTFDLALIGPNANATKIMQANYAGNAPYLISPLEALREYVPVTYAQGCDVACTDTSGFDDAASVAKAADVVVMVMGLDTSQENEGHDRTDINLPGSQEALIDQVCAVAKSSVILVIMSGGPVDISDEQLSDCIGAILWAGYPGQSGGTAIATTLFGDNNPSGRLTQTWYKNQFTKDVSMFDMAMRANTTSGYPGRTHRFYTGTPLYKFGDGMSYSDFAYDWATEPVSTLRAAAVQSMVDDLQSRLPLDMPSAMSLSIAVSNTRGPSGRHTVPVFAHPPANAGAPIRNLAGYGNVFVAANGTEVVDVELSPLALQYADEAGAYRVVTGEWELRVGQPTLLTHKLNVV